MMTSPNDFDLFFRPLIIALLSGVLHFAIALVITKPGFKPLTRAMILIPSFCLAYVLAWYWTHSSGKAMLAISGAGAGMALAMLWNERALTISEKKRERAKQTKWP